MIKLAPKQIQNHEVPEPVKGLVLTNETLAALDADISVEGGIMKIVIKGIYLGKAEDPQENLAKTTWKLS